MSKRPKTANGVMSRLRRPADRLRDLPIWSKLGLIMLVPTLATIIVGVSGLVDHIDTASNAERARTLSVLSEAAGGLVDALQNERAYGVMIAETDDKAHAAEHAAAIQSYKDENPKVDAAKAPYAQQQAALDSVPDKVGILLLRLERNLADLPTQRTSISLGKVSDSADVEGTYDKLIDDLLSVRDASAQLANDPTLSDHLRAVAAVARAKEYVAEQRDIGHKILGTGKLDETLRKEFLSTVTGFDLARTTLDGVGTQAESDLFSGVDVSPQGRLATNFTKPLLTLQGANAARIPFTSQTWETAMTGYNGQFRLVEKKLDADIVKEATDLRNSVNRRVFIETSVLLAMLLLAILFAWLVARSMARSLRELRQGALSIAQFGLPHAVSRLRDPTLSSSLTPAQLADQIAEPLPVRSRDEFGQVTEAFNAVHLEAVRTAAEQAALRSSVATMFVNLARRSQILVDRLIGHLDRLERGEEDPDRLAELFQLDHLATRMRRNDENLLVLAGADSTRVQREPAALIDVLRAAQSEVEHYTRIEFGMIDRDIEVAAHAVNDMVHLVAELFDNATAFSPPNSTVIVEARRLGDGSLLSVEDRGIGISREQLRDLNERLANPPMVDVAVSRMMGLVVVARLANRHGVKVELRPSDTERGTVAEVGLPLSVLVSGAAIADRAGSGNKYDMPVQAQQYQSSRPALPEPLALESGNGGYSGGGRPFDPNPPINNGGMLGTSGRSGPGVVRPHRRSEQRLRLAERFGQRQQRLRRRHERVLRPAQQRGHPAASVRARRAAAWFRQLRRAAAASQQRAGPVRRRFRWLRPGRSAPAAGQPAGPGSRNVRPAGVGSAGAAGLRAAAAVRWRPPGLRSAGHRAARLRAADGYADVVGPAGLAAGRRRPGRPAARTGKSRRGARHDRRDPPVPARSHRPAPAGRAPEQPADRADPVGRSGLGVAGLGRPGLRSAQRCAAAGGRRGQGRPRGRHRPGCRGSGHGSCPDRRGAGRGPAAGHQPGAVRRRDHGVADLPGARVGLVHHGPAGRRPQGAGVQRTRRRLAGHVTTDPHRRTGSDDQRAATGRCSRDPGIRSGRRHCHQRQRRERERIQRERIERQRIQPVAHRG